MRPCAPDGCEPAEIDARLRGEAARQRAHRDAAREPRRPVVALGRAHLAERIERDRALRAPAEGARGRHTAHAAHWVGAPPDAFGGGDDAAADGAAAAA